MRQRLLSLVIAFILGVIISQLFLAPRLTRSRIGSLFAAGDHGEEQLEGSCAPVHSSHGTAPIIAGQEEHKLLHVSTPTAPTPTSSHATPPRANAAFVILLQNKDLHEMRRTMRMLEYSFNQRYNYPYIFLNNEPFTEHFMAHIRGMTSANVQFGVIPKEHWSYPATVNQTQAALNRQQMEANKVPYGASESYRHMCRFESGFIYRHELVQPLDYYWRVEPGVEFPCDIDFDPFLYMQKHRIKYGFTIALPEYVSTIPTLWKNVQRFMQQYPHHIATRNSLAWISYDNGDTYNNCHFWSNFEIVDTSFFKSQAYQDYFDLLDATGGFFYERWGDAPVHSIAAALMLDRREIHFFSNIGYRHGIYEHCPESPALQLKCACNPADNVDWRPYSCLRRFLET